MLIGFPRNPHDKTAVLLSSDHGFFLGEHHLYDKRLMYEPSIRVPMLLRYPGKVRPGATSEEMVLNLDMAPTLLQMAGLPIPGEMQGKSMLPLAEGERIPWREDWLYEYYQYPGFENVRRVAAYARRATSTSSSSSIRGNTSSTISRGIRTRCTTSMGSPASRS
jgi:arylsulfatase A-like enzyme